MKVSRNCIFYIAEFDGKTRVVCLFVRIFLFGKNRFFFFDKGINLRLSIKVGGGGGVCRNKAWDRETMFSQLAKQSARQRFYERAGNFFTVISPVSAARVQR